MDVKRTFPLWLLALALGALALAWSPDAHAQVRLNQGFQCLPDGTANGRLFEQRTCQITQTTILAGTVCTFEQTLSQIFSNLYCGMKDAIMTPLVLLMTLAMMIFAIMFLTGMTRLTAGEAAKFGIKILLVFVFATQAELAIGLAYKFFITVTQEGISIVLSKLAPSGAYNNGNLEWNADSAMKYMDQLVIEAATPLTLVPSNLPSNAQPVDNAGGACQNALLVLLGLTAFFLPPLFIMIVYVIMQTIFVFVRAVAGYLLALTGITFLMTMSPIFLCFSLFHVTYKFFEKWLQYIISFTLQMIIIFAFLAFTQLMDYGKFLGRVMELVKPYVVGAGDVAALSAKSTAGALFGPFLINRPLCSICEFEMKMLPYYNQELPVCKANYKVIPPWDLSFHSEFAQMLVLNLISLGVLAYVLEAFLRYVPEIAKQIAGVPWSARVGGGAIEGVAGRSFGTEGGTAHFFGSNTMIAAKNNFLRGFELTPGYTGSKVIGAMTNSTRGLGSNLRSESLRAPLGSQGQGAGSFMADAPTTNPLPYFKLK